MTDRDHALCAVDDAVASEKRGIEKDLEDQEQALDVSDEAPETDAMDRRYLLSRGMRAVLDNINVMLYYHYVE